MLYNFFLDCSRKISSRQCGRWEGGYMFWCCTRNAFLYQKTISLYLLYFCFRLFAQNLKPTMWKMRRRLVYVLIFHSKFLWEKSLFIYSTASLPACIHCLWLYFTFLLSACNTTYLLRNQSAFQKHWRKKRRQLPRNTLRRLVAHLTYYPYSSMDRHQPILTYFVSGLDHFVIDLALRDFIWKKYKKLWDEFHDIIKKMI